MSKYTYRVPGTFLFAAAPLAASLLILQPLPIGFAAVVNTSFAFFAPEIASKNVREKYGSYDRHSHTRT
jgi:hypothetical protein